MFRMLPGVKGVNNTLLPSSSAQAFGVVTAAATATCIRGSPATGLHLMPPASIGIVSSSSSVPSTATAYFPITHPKWTTAAKAMMVDSAHSPSTYQCRTLPSCSSNLFSTTRVSLQRGSSGNGDFYSILGVSPDAPQEEVKASYKRLALQYHPDRNKAPDAEEKFKTISEAYACIGHKDKRAEYDAARRSGFGGFGGSSSSSSSSGGSSTYQGQRGYNRGGGGGGFHHGQGMWPGNAQNVRPGSQQHPHVRTLTREEAEQMFRKIFNMGIDQMASGNTANRGMGGQGGMGGAARGGGLNSNIGSLFTNIAQQGGRGGGGGAGQHPFFRGGANAGGATESTRVSTDEFGNRSVHRQYRDANGNIYNIYTEESDDPDASVNQTREQVNEKYYDPRTGRYNFGTYGSVNEEKGGGGFTNWSGIQGGGRGEGGGQSTNSKDTGASSDGSNSNGFPQYAQFIYRNTPVGGNPGIRFVYVLLWTSLILTLGIYFVMFLFSHPMLLALVLAIMTLRRMQPRRF